MTIPFRPAVLLAASPAAFLARYVHAPEQPRPRPIVLGNRRRRADRVIRPNERAAA